MKTKILLIALLFSLGKNVFCQNNASGKVIKIVDGDTFDLLLENKTSIRIRMNGIDCPEKKQPYFNNAKQALANYIFGKKVIAVYSKKDKYKRVIADVYCNNENINIKMTANGFAWHYKKYSTDINLDRAELKARVNKIGIWSLPNPIAPWDFRKIK